MNYELVKTLTADDIYLSGLYVEGDKSKPAVIYIHGFEGDFYTGIFTETVAEALEPSGCAFIAIQHRGTGKSTEFYMSNGDGKNVGGDFELLSEAHLDITAWIKFLQSRGYSNVILAGHSLGTIKAIRYLFEGELPQSVSKLLLICPFDKNSMIDDFTRGKYLDYVAQARLQIEAGKGREQIPKYFDTAELSFQVYASWYEDTELGHMFDFYKPRYDFPALTKIKVPVHVVVGTKDEFFHPSNPGDPAEAMQILLKYIPGSSGKLVAEATHSFKGHESELAAEIIKFCQ